MTEEKADRVRPLARRSLRLQSDERLLKLFRRGVEPAFDELVRRYRNALVGYAGSIAGRDRAEDVVQESLVKAHRSLGGDREIDPRPWLYAVVRNTALNDVRDNRKHRHLDLVESPGHGGTPDDVVEQRERFAAVLAAVADLPPAQRRALVDHELSGFSHEEIAAELELSTGATKQLIYRARLTLRNACGAMIPLPLVAWLAESPGLFATGAAGGGATATGLIGAIGGGGAAKLAAVAVVAGSTIAGGIAVEKHDSHPHRESSGTAQAAPFSSANAYQVVSDVQPASSADSDDGDQSSKSGQQPDDSSRPGAIAVVGRSSGSGIGSEKPGEQAGGAHGSEPAASEGSVTEGRPTGDSGGDGSGRESRGDGPGDRLSSTGGSGSGRNGDSEVPPSGDGPLRSSGPGPAAASSVPRESDSSGSPDPSRPRDFPGSPGSSGQ